MRCENCNGMLSVQLRYVEGRMIMRPYVYTTSYGGSFCGTSCSMSYINQRNTTQNDTDGDLGMHVQRKKHRTTTASTAS